MHDVEKAVQITERYADFCDQQAEPNHPNNLVAWQCWKDHAHSARKVAELIRQELLTPESADNCTECDLQISSKRQIEVPGCTLCETCAEKIRD